VGLDGGALALFGQHPIDSSPQGTIECHLAEPGFRVHRSEEPRELAARLNNGDRPNALTIARTHRAGLGAVDQIAKFLSESVVALARSLGRYLNGDGIETLFVALCMATD
jgi:hypothetical protein